MKEFFTKIAMKHILIFRIFVLCISIWLVTYLMPREIRFKYDYSEGKPWQYENLYADFPFSIKKENSQLKAEEKIIREQAKQYYYLDSLIQQNQKIRFNTNFDALKSLFFVPKDSLTEFEILNINDSLDIIKTEGLNYLNYIYTKGVLKNSVLSKSNLYLKEGNKVKPLHKKDYLTLLAASEFFKKTNLLPHHKNQLKQIILNYIEPNILFDEAFTIKDVNETLSNVPQFKGKIEQESLLIAKGQLLNKDTFEKVKSYQNEFEERNTNRINLVSLWFGQLLMVSLCMLVLYFFINQFREDIIENSTNMTFIFFNVVLMFVMAKICISIDSELIYMMPFCLLPIILKAFYDTRLALFAHLITILLVAFIVPDSFEFIFIQLMGGIISILAVLSMYRRADLFISAIKIIGVYALSYLAMEILQNTSIESIDYSKMFYLMIGGALTIIAYPLIYIFEKLFGLISDISLLELADTNSPLLKKLQNQAPGTFQHSLQVANLAESGVSEIGGNVLLVRVGALYHDIGKMKAPSYFIENQNTEVNPHDELEYNQSAKIIIEHVLNGIEIGKKHNLPDRIIDFIRTHHGSSTVQYFYKKYQNENPEGNLTIDDFKYPGPKPFSKETAVLMMADSVEAASKSIKEPNALKIDSLVEKIIDHQVNSGQLDHADISLKQITLIKKIFKGKLRNIYHLRIEYPE